MKKTSAYARKKLHKPRVANPRSAWQMAIARCSSYDEAHAQKASELILILRTALQRLKDGRTSAENTTDHDEVMHALATARVRAEHIAGKDNEAEPVLMGGVRALNRMAKHWETHRVWTVSAQDAPDLDAAVEAYTTILRASSPMQMELAWNAHIKRLEELLENSSDEP